MNETLVIRFRDPAEDTVHWYLLDQQGQRLGAPGQGRLSECRELAAGRRQVLLMPGERVALMDAQIPTRKKQRILQAAPWVLEERLAQDVTTLHFALGPRLPDDSIRIAVVAREDMEALRDHCKAAELTPAAILPDYLTLPIAAQEWTIMVEGPRVMVRTGESDGFSTDRELALDMIEFSLPDEGDGQAAGPHGIRLLRPEADRDFLDALADRLGHTVEIDDRPFRDQADQVFVPVVTSRHGIDLAEGEFRLRKDEKTWWQPWRPVLALASAWLLVLAVSEGVHVYQLSSESQTLDGRIEQVFRDALPDAQRMVDPRLRMEQRLNALRGAGGQGDFLPALAVMSEGMAILDNSNVRGLSYRPGFLDLNLRVSEGQALDRFKDTVEEQPGYEAVIQSATPRDDYVDGRLQIRGPGAR
ncbi:type II secretion system protein GspL [Natronospira bacteriovora]|uniref:Type II secretion system protein L n=1 Tax=Natronospira bacteriovora TaxID=3069753 RepID=A0ABU0W5H1_9GAMM|nr:type II secretion system protein GspL [Natronospira sp. AB-CW4]MDQ2069246.1 type II secretion system protein GspL [Natronospira sp. AB-CW4]